MKLICYKKIRFCWLTGYVIEKCTTLPYENLVCGWKL